MSYNNFGSSSSSSIIQSDNQYPNFEFCDDFLDFTHWFEEEEHDGGGQSQSPTDSMISNNTQQEDRNINTWDSGSSGKEKKVIKDKVAFKTKSEIEILNDGYKWRKYGKKMVKNSPNPRNYYKCSAEGCTVKKRIERDKEDPKYVITTYEGIHNHIFPSG